jgi:uncharacterized lipoprotein YmbA
MSVEVRDETASRHDTPLLTRVYESQQKADTERPEDVVQALSVLVEKIAQEIAKDLSGVQ